MVATAYYFVGTEKTQIKKKKWNEEKNRNQV